MNTLFLVALIVEGILGIGFLFLPATIMGLAGVTLDPIATFLGKMFGTAILTFSFILWFARKSDNQYFRKGMVFSMVAYNAIILIVLVSIQLSGIVNAMQWGTVGLHLILLVWFGYYLVKK